MANQYLWSPDANSDTADVTLTNVPGIGQCALNETAVNTACVVNASPVKARNVGAMRFCPMLIYTRATDATDLLKIYTGSAAGPLNDSCLANEWVYDATRYPYHYNVTGWRHVNIPAIFTGTLGGSYSTKNIGIIRIRLDANVTTGGKVGIGPTRINKPTVNPFVVCKDDGKTNDHTVTLPAAQATGMPITLAIAGSLIDTAGYMTLAQLKAWKAALGPKLCIVNHSWEHQLVSAGGVKATNGTYPAHADYVKWSIQTNAAWLIANGLSTVEEAYHVVLPLGAASSETIQAISDAGGLSARNVQSGHLWEINPTYCVTKWFIPSYYCDYTSKLIHAADMAVRSGGMTTTYAHDDGDNTNATRVTAVFAELMRRHNAGDIRLMTYVDAFNLTAPGLP